MNDDSPLFVSALELIAHATELYSQKNSRKYKFVILHLANAVELILKDLLINKGISIYNQKTSETIGIWSSFEKLEQLGIKVLERPIIELLIDDRNTIQHRFGFPNAESTSYYLTKIIIFMERFLDDNYNVKLKEALEPHLTKEMLELLGLVRSEFDYLDRIFEVSPESAIIQAYNILEDEIRHFLGNTNDFRRPLRHEELRNIFENLDLENSFSRFSELRQWRNRAAHFADNDPKSPVWEEMLNIAKELISGFRKAQNTG